MAIPEEKREMLLAYCRIDENAAAADQALLNVLYDSAIEYLICAGVTAPTSSSSRSAQYDLCICYLVLDAYDRRDSTIVGTSATDNPAFRRLINQLKLTEPVSNPDTGS